MPAAVIPKCDHMGPMCQVLFSVESMFMITNLNFLDHENSICLICFKVEMCSFFEYYIISRFYTTLFQAFKGPPVHTTSNTSLQCIPVFSPAVCEGLSPNLFTNCINPGGFYISIFLDAGGKILAGALTNQKAFQ